MSLDQSPLRLVGNRFQIHDPIGAGGMGTVYRATNIDTGEIVAVKVLKPEAVDRDPGLIERFRREADALRQLNHPNIVKVLAAFDTEGHHYIVMEYVRGGSLHDLLKHVQPDRLPINRIVYIALELADALSRAHHLKIVHRDIKPANVLIAEDGSPRLTDFGVAQFGTKERVTHSGLIIGTPDYLSPEMLNGEVVDHRADIWAFGVMLFEMLSGRRPFLAETLSQVLFAIAAQPVPDLETLRPDAPIALVDLINRMLSKNPATRIPSVRLVGAELEAILVMSDLVVTASQGYQRATHYQRPSQDDATVVTTIPAAGSPKHNLPAQTTPFVGREDELVALRKLVEDEDVRLVTILAPGGMGKTRLALEVVRQFAAEILSAAHFPDGIFFVQLAPLSSKENLVSAIGDVVDYHFQRDEHEPREQLLKFLHGQTVLLVLDNFEHLLDAVPLIGEILAAAPGVTVLATSREHLNLQGETLFRIEGMGVPDRKMTHDAGQHSAVKLFLQSARQTRPGFELLPEDVPFVVNICQMVKGMPLGIVLAAAWVDLLALHEIADEIARNLDFLETASRNVPERQRSIRAVFEYSWNLLHDAERETLMKLSVFRGGFTRDAAQTVADANLRILLALVNKSLLRRDPESGRYDIHDLLRQYAEHRLELYNQIELAQNAHSDYYLAFLSQREFDLKGRRQLEALDEIEAEIENVRQAWHYAAKQRHVDALYGALESFYLFCRLRSRFQEADEFFGLVLEHFAPQSNEVPDLFWARSFVRYWTVREPDNQVKTQIETSLRITQKEFNQVEIALCLRALGMIAKNGHDYPTALVLLEESLKLYRQLNRGYEVAQTLSLLANYYRLNGQTANETQYFQESFDLSCDLGDKVGAAVAQYDLGATALFAGKYGVAEQAIREATSRLAEIGNWEEASWSKTGLGLLVLLRGSLEEAKSLAEKALEIAEDTRSSKSRAFALVLQGAVASLEERYTKSRELCEESRHASSYILIPIVAAWWHAMASCGLEDYETAQQDIYIMLKFAAAVSSLAAMTWCLPVISILMAYSGRKEEAVEHFALAFTHPASATGWLEKWPFLSRFRLNLQRELDAQHYAAAWERGKALDLQTVVMELLANPVIV